MRSFEIYARRVPGAPLVEKLLGTTSDITYVFSLWFLLVPWHWDPGQLRNLWSPRYLWSIRYSSSDGVRFKGSNLLLVNARIIPLTFISLFTPLALRYPVSAVSTNITHTTHMHVPHRRHHSNPSHTYIIHCGAPKVSNDNQYIHGIIIWFITWGVNLHW